MKAIVVYESHWGNTASIARAIADGLGVEAAALTTSEASAAALDGIDLIVAGAPILGFSLPTKDMINSLSGPQYRAIPPDLSHPAMREWLDGLPNGNIRVAAFETRIWWSPGSAAKTILGELGKLGYQPIGAEKFIVKDKHGPLKEGELERAKKWGEELAKLTWGGA